jgi:hypothetical protein
MSEIQEARARFEPNPEYKKTKAKGAIIRN